MKKIFSFSLAFLLLITGMIGAGGTAAFAAGITDHIEIKGYDPKMDYMAAMKRALKDGSPYAMQVGAIYEKQRNYKIDALKRTEEKTNYFSQYTTAQEILAAMEKAERKYTDEDLDLLARIIYAEAGCSWYPDWVQQMVGSVVLNRVASSYYPNTIREVIYQPGQYPPAWNGMLYRTPDARTIANAKYLMEHGSICPSNVIGQNGVVCGSGVYRTFYDSVLDSTIYFCYM